MVTGNMSAPNNTDSVVMTVDTVTGYPEYAYWKIALLIPAIVENTDLYTRFYDVQVYQNKSDKTSNYEDLFNLTSGEGTDPEESSLFNITTLKDLLAAGSSVKDIIDKP